MLVCVPEEITFSISGPAMLAEVGVDDINGSGGGAGGRVGGSSFIYSAVDDFLARRRSAASLHPS